MMHPILLRIGDYPLHTFGLFAALALLAGSWLAERLGRRAGIRPGLMTDAVLPAVVGGLLGARALYVLLHWPEFQGAWGEIPKIWRGGLMWQGGLLAGALCGAWFVRKRGGSLAAAADAAAPAAALGQAIGRIGCLFAGCCYGRACSLPWAVTFRRPESLAPTDVPLHPTQLYDLGLNALIFLGLMAWAPRLRPGSGRIAALYLVLAAAARLAVEPFRGDDRGPVLGPFSSTALGAVALLALGLILSWRLAVRGRDR